MKSIQSFLQIVSRWSAPWIVMATLTSGAAGATSCGAIPDTYPITAGSGSLTVGSGSQVNGTTISGSGTSVQMSATRTTSTPTFASLSPSSYPTFSSSNSTSGTSVASGTYSSVTPGTGTTTFTGGTYYITNLTASAANTQLVFGSGTYYITTASLSGSSLSVTLSGSVIINIGSSFSTASGSTLNNGGTLTNLRLFVYPNASVTLGSSTLLSGIIYGPGTGTSVSLGTSAQITGLVAVNGTVSLAGSNTVTLSSSNQTAVGGVSTCNSTSGPDHYQVMAVGTAVNCYEEPIFIFPRTSSDGATNTTDTMLLTTSTGHGDWTFGSGHGTFTAGTSNSGNASYTWSSIDGVALFFLHDTYPETVTVGVTDGAITATSGGATSGDDSPITFAPTGFRITNGNNSPAIIGTQVAGVTSTQSLALQAIQTDTNTGACTSVFPSGTTVTIGLASQCNNPSSCVAGQSLSVTNNNTTTRLASNPNSGITAYTQVPLTFSTSNAEAPIAINYSDAGQITLAAKYNLPLANGSASVNNMVGTSQFVVQPYTLKLSNIQGTSSGTVNPGASTATGAVFVGAGVPFSATVTAVNYQGNATPNFGQESTPPTVTLNEAMVLPASGHNPSVTGSFGPFSSGSASGTAFSWPEVGIITLTPVTSSYLSTGVITGTTSGNIGRFVPASFSTTVNTPVFATACSAGSFTYVGQPFTYSVAPVITATALSQGGTTTQNYTGSFMRMTNASLTGRTYTPTPASPGLTTTGLPATTADPAIADIGAGQVTLTFSAGTGLSFTRGTAIPPFTANIALSENVIDLDGITASNPVTFGASSGIAFSSGANQYYGRAAVRDGVGSELLDLPMPLTTQYYYSSTTGFVPNTADSCSSAPMIAFSNYQLNLSAGATCVRDTGSPGTSGAGCSAAAAASSRYAATAVTGSFNLNLAAPGSGNNGAVTVTATVPSWLQYLWSVSSGTNSNPSAMATFGLFPGSVSRIYQREVY